MGFLKFKNNKVIIPDWFTSMPESMVDSLLSMIRENPQATRKNTISEGIGEFGLEKTNPIPTFGISEKRNYLESLRTLNGERIFYDRTGSVSVKNIHNPVDEYEIFNYQGETIAFLYISAYHWRTSKKSPIGFSIVKAPKNIPIKLKRKKSIKR